MPAQRTDASIPDAAKPQHFCLEVEARFRDLSRSTYGFQSRSVGTQLRRLYWLYLLHAHGLYAETHRERSLENAILCGYFMGRSRNNAGVTHRRTLMQSWLAALRRLSFIPGSISRSAMVVGATLSL